MTPEEVINKQLEGYNACDVEAFAAMYAAEVQTIDGSGKVLCDGIADVREVYGAMFRANPHQMCVVLKRIVAGEYVIDEEDIIGRADNKRRRAVVIYRVKADHIVHATILTR